MRGTVLTLGLSAALACVASIAQASTLSFGVLSGTGEAAINLSGCNPCTSSTGTAATTPPSTIDFNSPDSLHFASGNATISTTGGGTFNDVTIGAPGYTFTDLDFFGQITGNTNSSFTITDNFNNSLSATLPNGTLTEFIAESTVPLSSLTLSSLFGISQLKNFAISGLSAVGSSNIGAATPIPGTLLSFAGGLSLIGLSGFRRRRKNQGAHRLVV